MPMPLFPMPGLSSAFRRTTAILVAALLAGGPALAATDPADRYPDLHLIPWPKSLERNDGRMALGTESRIVVGDDRLRPLAAVLAEEVAKLTGLNLPVTAGAGRAGDVVL